MSDYTSNYCSDLENLGHLILDELKLIRNDINAELKQLRNEINQRNIATNQNISENLTLKSNILQSFINPLTEEEDSNIFLPLAELKEEIDSNSCAMSNSSGDDNKISSDSVQSKVLFDSFGVDTENRNRICKESGSNISKDNDSDDCCNQNHKVVHCDNIVKQQDIPSNHNANVNTYKNAVKIPSSNRLNLEKPETNCFDVTFSKNFETSTVIEKAQGTEFKTHNFYEIMNSQNNNNHGSLSPNYCNNLMGQESRLINNKLSREIKQLHQSLDTWKCEHCFEIFQCSADLLSHNCEQADKSLLSTCSNQNFPQINPKKVPNNRKISKSKLNNKSDGKVQTYKSFWATQTSNAHTSNSSFNCTICNKHFTQNSDLTEHRKIHIQDKIHRCFLCNRNFKYCSALRRHEKLHTGEKPHACPICGERFSRKDRLTVHIRIHTGEKPYCCPVCNKGFREKSSLTQHVRLHSREKPFVCLVCNERFWSNLSLTNHMSVHSKKCDVSLR